MKQKMFAWAEIPDNFFVSFELVRPTRTPMFPNWKLSATSTPKVSDKKEYERRLL